MRSEGMDAQAILVRAREIVAAGWTRRAYVSGDGTSYCAMGAIYSAAGLGPSYCFPTSSVLTAEGAPSAEAAARLARVIEPNYLDNPIGRNGDDVVMAWNDKRWRTQAQVLAKFDKAITAGVTG